MRPVLLLLLSPLLLATCHGEHSPEVKWGSASQVTQHVLDKAVLPSPLLKGEGRGQWLAEVNMDGPPTPAPPPRCLNSRQSRHNGAGIFVNHQHKFVFIKIGKNGGTAVLRSVLSPWLCPVAEDSVVEPAHCDERRRAKKKHSGVDVFMQMMAGGESEEVEDAQDADCTQQELFGGARIAKGCKPFDDTALKEAAAGNSTALSSLWKDYFVFGVVRNPYTRAMSAWKYLRKGAYMPSMPLQQFCRNPALLINSDREMNHMEPQSSCLFDNAGKPVVDFFVRLEHMEEDMTTVHKLLLARAAQDGRPAPPPFPALPKKSSKQANAQQYDEETWQTARSDTCKKGLQAYYRRDFELLQFRP